MVAAHSSALKPSSSHEPETPTAVAGRRATCSLLYRNADAGRLRQAAPEPACFSDLNLDQIVAAITANKAEYDLKPIYYTPLHDAADIAYRQQVMRDIERPEVLRDLNRFAAAMRSMRQALSKADSSRYQQQKQRWLVEAASTYCRAVNQLADDLADTKPTSPGLTALREHLNNYLDSRRFESLQERTQSLVAALSAIRYSLHINGGTVAARRYTNEQDYGQQLTATFERFRQGATASHAFSFQEGDGLDSVEAAILGLVVKLYPHTFSELDSFAAQEWDFADATVIACDREAQFFIAYLEFTHRLRNAGLNFCYPVVHRDSKQVYDEQGFDLALANKLIADNQVPVCNDFQLRDGERMIVVSGPNQGGKTTFARAFGQLHYLAALGCPVPGTRAQLFLFDQLLTHFERQEDAAKLQSKLQDDLLRARAILDVATPNSVVIMNEVFTSTTLRDATALSRRIAERIKVLDLVCVWVTFVEEVASLGPKTVSMVSTVQPDDPAQRTYKIIRQPADGLAYALALADRHGLTEEQLRSRLEP